MKHYKEIEITCTGMIIARVFCEDGRRTGLEYFNISILDQFTKKNYPVHLEKRCKEAHEWADKVVAICDKYEIKAGGL